MEKDWRKETFSDIERWYDENGVIRKTVYTQNSVYTFYYDENSRWHSIDGPARFNDTEQIKQWYYHGKRIFCNTQEEFEKLLKLKAFW